MRIGAVVKINDSNEWNGLYGVVRYICKNIAYIFCVQNPCNLYIATENNDICIIKE